MKPLLQTIRENATHTVLEHLVRQHYELDKRNSLFTELQNLRVEILDAAKHGKGRQGFESQLERLEQELRALPEYNIEVVAAESNAGIAFVTPVRTEDRDGKNLMEKVLQITGERIEKIYGSKFVQKTAAGFVSFGDVTGSRSALKRLGTELQGDTRLHKFNLQVYLVPETRDLKISMDCLGKESIAIEAKTAAVHKGAIGIPLEYIGTFFPDVKKRFVCIDRSSEEWKTYVASQKVSSGVCGFVTRENKRFAAQGKIPFQIGDMIEFVRIGDNRYFVELQKASCESCNNTARSADSASPAIPTSRTLELVLLPTAIRYRTINVPRDYIGNVLPAEGVQFPVCDVQGNRWHTEIKSSKMSQGISNYLRREKQRLGSYKPGDKLMLSDIGQQGQHLWKLEIKKA